MGLLTSPDVSKSTRKFANIFFKYEVCMCALSYVIGIAWFMLLAYAPFIPETYFSENALLPGLVNNDFQDFRDIKTNYESLKKSVKANNGQPPRQWLCQQFQQAGLEVYTQNFSLQHPFIPDKSIVGTNVYAVLRSPRGSSTEGVVLTVPLPRSHTDPFTDSRNSGVRAGLEATAVVLTMANFFANQIYWAKDVVFLLTDQGQIGAAAWLSAYYQVSVGHDLIQMVPLPVRAGNLQAAVTVDVVSSGTTQPSTVDVMIEGVNGQLPNLDLVNLGHRMCLQERLVGSVRSRLNHARPTSSAGWLHSGGTMLSMMSALATSQSTGTHGHFTRLDISSITLQLRHTSNSPASSSLFKLSRALEGVFRSLNNLQERFHQSFFFYLLPASNRYVSIGLYLPPFALIAASVVLEALASWLVFTGAGSSDSLQKDDAGFERGSPGTVSSVDATGCFFAILTVLASSFVFCFGYFGALPYLVRYLTECGASVDCSLAISFGAVIVLSSLLPFSFDRRSYAAINRLLHCVVCLQLALFMFTTALFNISLATLTAGVYSPLTVLLPTSVKYTSRLRKCFTWLLLALTNPVLAQFCLPVISSLIQSSIAGETIVVKSVWQPSTDWLQSALESWLVFGSNQLQLSCCLLLPLWMQLVCVMRACDLELSHNSSHLKRE